MITKKDKNCLIIAEAGVNHNGKLDLALKLCDKAKEIGADVIKFQTWKTENLITKDLKQADYQADNTGIKESQFDMLKKLELSFEDFKIIKKHCDEINMIFASTADEEESLDFLIELGIPFIKIGSGDICNISYLRYIGSKKLPIILSTGMSTLNDITTSIKALKDGGATDITLLHCTTNYPCPYNDVNLNAMLTLKNEFGVDIGYSDHTKGTEIAIAAVAMGAKIIEKHFTLDCNMQGPDHLASTDPIEFKKLINSIKNVELALGKSNKEPTETEKEISKVVTKRIVALTPIKKGDILSRNNICVKRALKGAKASCWDEFINTKAIKNYNIDEGIE